MKMMSFLLLYSLASSYKLLREIFLFGKRTLPIKDIKSSLLCKKRIDKQINNNVSEGIAKGLIAKERPKYRDFDTS